MKKDWLTRTTLILLSALLCASLAGCGKGNYDEGYEAGFLPHSKPPRRKQRNMRSRVSF